jgi:hypothetical protein
MHARDGFDGVVLLDHAVGAVGEFKLVVLGPPVFEIAGCVELAAFIVETMGELVADG